MALIKGLFRSTGDSGLSPINTQGRTILNWLSQIFGSIPAAADLAAILARLDVNLSTRASQATLATLATEATLAAQLDVLLSSRASEATLAAVLAELDDKVDKATTPVMYNVAITLANTEYPQALPADTKKFLIKTRDGTSFRLAFVTGKVAGSVDPFTTVPASGIYWEDFIEPGSITLYFACAVAGKKAEIIAWS